MKTGRKMLALLLALIFVLSCAACGGGGDKSAGADGLTIKVGTPNALPGAFDSTASTGKFNPHETMHLVYDYLFERDGDTNELFSDVLEEWHYEDDTTFIMKLRDGIKFTDGTQMTGEDVLFSMSCYMDRQSPFAGQYTYIDFENSTVSEDGLTITLKTLYPYGPGPFNVFTPIVCKKWVEENGYDTEIWASAPNGSGPYKVESYVADVSCTLTLKDETWNDYKSPVKSYVFTNYADKSTMFMDLENGVIDIALNISSTDFERVYAEGGDNIAVEAALGGSYDTFCMDTSNEFLSDKNVRLAIAYGVDWQAVGEASFGHLYEQPQSLLAPNSEFYNPDVKMYEYNPEYAKQLLEEAGYKDGEIHFNIIGSPQLGQDTVAESIQYYLAQIGITYEIEMYEMASTIPYWLGLEDHLPDTMLVGESCACDPYMHLQSLMLSTPNGFPTAQVDDDKFNELADAAMGTTDPELRKQYFYELQQYAYDTCLVIPGIISKKATGYRTDVISDVAFQSYQMNPNLKYITCVGYEDMSLIGKAH